MEEEVYDSLSQAQKHIMLKNGGFEFDTKQSSCCCGCGHSVTEHLDYVDCCLSKELCLCDRLLMQGKLPHKQKEDKQLDSYIQQIARM
jgi:hypothetical protein